MSKQSTLENDTKFLFEMGNIRHINRMWHRFFGTNYANVAEHHFRVYWIAMVIASHEKDVDLGKIAKMVMIHDITESRTNDYDMVAREYTVRKDELAIKDMLGGTVLETEFYDIWAEYEERQSIEAKIVKDADNLDCDFELSEQEQLGNTSKKALQSTRDYVYKNKLSTKTAKKIYKEIQASNPHSWYLTARNRKNSGEWSK